MENKQNDNVFQEDERALIEKSLKIRESIIDKYMEENKGATTDNRDNRVINELLNSLDSLVLGKVDRRLKHENNNSNEELVGVIKDILLSNKKDNSKKDIVLNPVVDVEITDIVPGEDKIEYEELDMKDFDNIIEG